MRPTPDSNERFQDAIRVDGAPYGVTLVVPSDGSEPNKPTHQPASRTRWTATPPRTQAGVAAVKSSRRGTATRSADAADNAEVRTRARNRGLTISDRGRVRASVITAYHSAHQ